MSEPKGALFFYKDEPHIIGFFTINGEHYELVGVKRSNIRTDLKGRRIDIPQGNMFDDGSGDGAQ